MDGIISVISKSFEILQTRLNFGGFSFTLFSVWICFGGISLAAFFFSRLFDSK